MSRIGKQPITIPQEVEVSIKGNMVSASGPKGKLKQAFETEFVTVKLKDGTIVVGRVNDEKTTRARHGLYRSLFKNIIEGVQTGFSKKMEIKGVGYRGKVAGKDLELSLGYSHPINYELPEGITVEFEPKSQVLFSVYGIDKQLVGSVAAKIRSFRKPEPYKGKGVRYVDEHVKMKAGKSAAK